MMSPQATFFKRGLSVVSFLIAIVVIVIITQRIVKPPIKVYYDQSSGNRSTFQTTNTTMIECSKSDAKDQHNVSQGEEIAVKIPSPIILPVKIDSFVPDRLTVIIPTYKRVVLLKQVLSHLCGLDSLVDCIIVVWNDIEEPIPSDLLQFSCSVRLYLKKETTNSLHNRFIHYPEIRTEAILAHDDDLFVPKEELDFEFQTWKSVKHLIVGFMKRMHIERHPPENSRKYEYQIYNVDRYSMMITNSAIFHVQYLDLYQSTLPVEFRNFVDKNMNCEDLFFNAVVAKYLNDRFGYTACPCQAVDGANKLKKLEKKLPGLQNIGLSHKSQHQSTRELCLMMIDEQYSGIPMGSSTSIAHHSKDH